MIQNIRIQNFKSIVDLTLDLGRFNVIIGANGCGKTNILEAITMASAASQNKLDNEYLLNRDVRVAEPQFMVSAFGDTDEERIAVEKAIRVNIRGDEKLASGNLVIFYNDKEKKWYNIGNITERRAIQTLLNSISQQNGDVPILKEADNGIEQIERENPKLYQALKELFIDKPSLNSFLIYRPNEMYLREVKDSPIYPLGVRGEGLLQYLKTISRQEDTDYLSLIKEINEGLYLLDWFDGFSIPNTLMSNEYKLSIGDRYLNESLHYFDQRSTNEGFLYLLFFLTLFYSKETPLFFGVDNVETAFNPKLCTKLTEHLIGVSKKNNKQVIVTTHNPYVLDGMDLSDDEIRLFVARRDVDGHTRIERIPYREDRTMSLSDLWMSGLIGGLPDNF